MARRSGGRLTVGLVSDTHGVMRPEAFRALAGSDHVIHAGDIGSEAILDALERIAPLTAIRGNNDTAPWARRLPETQTLELADVRIHVVHDLAEMRADPVREEIRVVVSGHSHIPRILEREGVLYVNPGSAGPRRFRLPVSVGRLVIDAGRVAAELLELQVAPPKARATGRR